MSLAAFVAAQRADHGVPHAVACRALDVSESWFYKWRGRSPTARQQRRVSLDALKMAAAVRGGDVTGVIFHTDKGSEYTADLFARTCEALRVTQSMSRVGSALDNAVAESFNSTLEFELLSKHRFTSKTEARRAVARYIDCYNRTRRHSSCEMRSPIQYEAILAERAGQAAQDAEAA